MACEHPFTCAEQIEILGWVLEGTGWFLLMLLIALGLQIAANFVWIRNSQVTRELMKLKIEERGDYYLKSLLWTGISTIISITRIVLIGGNNLFIYITILVGNLAGTYWAQSEQHPDKYCLSGDIISMLRKKDNNKCSPKMRENINQALDMLVEEMSKRKPMKSYPRYVDNLKRDKIDF
tara:strand:+ start:787 stop:1323 length:537 start_codon:yes stop_codon:yes gene_type:complete